MTVAPSSCTVRAYGLAEPQLLFNLALRLGSGLADGLGRWAYTGTCNYVTAAQSPRSAPQLLLAARLAGPGRGAGLCDPRPHWQPSLAAGARRGQPAGASVTRRGQANAAIECPTNLAREGLPGVRAPTELSRAATGTARAPATNGATWNPMVRRRIRARHLVSKNGS